MFPSAAVMLVAAAMLLAGCADGEGGAASGPQEMPPAPVAVQEAEPGRVDVFAAYPGRIRGARNIQIIARV
ncbi:MAG TPA: hypothetical protein VK110_10220, partial [Salinisphaeraceae bacterium]|nr:hypothetical protein [Salinisphaeraceae bacterium]